MMHLRRFLALALLATILMTLVSPGATRAQAQEDLVAQVMAEMSVAAKVGQLFLVTFPGSEVTDDALITELIRDYHVGGVVLLPENGNIVNEGDTPIQVATLAEQLQDVAWAATQLVAEVPEEELPGPYVPLFVAVNHEGNGMPFTGIVNGMTPLPSQMALGATWNLSHTETIGQIVGQELGAMGVNMLLGPSLDVLEIPRPQSAGDLGVRVFGGEPFWVGQMAQSYIRGVHDGSQGRVAVIAKHFPGLGASERSLDEEVSTVQRTLDKLRQVDLAPFLAVAQSEDVSVRPDGLLVSHIRFRGLEGGRYATTRPISVDNQVLQRLLGLPELAGWREEGGVTVSDGLGVRALKRFYDPSEQSFNSRRIAQEALFAGNDLLFLSKFALTDSWEDQAANIRSTIAFFREKYDSDPAFQTAVDAAVARILRLKLDLYGDRFVIGLARPNVRRVSGQVGLGQEMVATIGRDAVTLLSPPSPDLVPSPPTARDNIVIFTDGRSGRPCATCTAVLYIDPLMLEETMVRLYGPSATGQVTPRRVSSFTFDELEEYLVTPPPGPTPTPASEEKATQPPPNPVGVALEEADWIIFAMLDPTSALPQAGAMRRFLAEQADALGDRRLIALAYDAPYYLDATEINKLSAYYVAYSRTETFIEASVRALFGEFAPIGVSPVSVTGINYDLFLQTSPDPEQTISLSYSVIKLSEESTPEPTLDSPDEGSPTPEPPDGGSPTPEPAAEGSPTPEPRPEISDELRLQTGVILDLNGHTVPDGTSIQFFFTYPQEGLEHSIQTTTHGGIAEAAVRLDRGGQLDISVQADPKPRTILLQFTIQEGQVVVISTPTPEPTPTPTSTPEPTPEPTPVETPLPTPEPEESEEVTEDGGAGFGDLLSALFGVLVVGGVGYYVVRYTNGPVEKALQLALWCVIGGLGLYVAYALRLPGADWLRERSGAWAGGWVAFFGSVVPLIALRLVDRQRGRE